MVEERLLDVKAVSLALGLCDRTIRRMVRTGQVPRPVKLGQGIRWQSSVLDQWMRNGCQPVQPVQPTADAVDA